MPANTKLPHLIIETPTASPSFAKRGNPQTKKTPLNNVAHGTNLYNMLKEIWPDCTQMSSEQKELGGTYVEFQLTEKFALPIEKLESQTQKDPIQLCAVRDEDNTRYATAFVPNAKKNHYLNSVEKYTTGLPCIHTRHVFPKYLEYKNIIAPFFVDINAEKLLQLKSLLSSDDLNKLDALDIPSDLSQKIKNLKLPKASLVESINKISLARVKSVWTSKEKSFPQEERQWCEVWLRDNDALFGNNIKTQVEERFTATVKILGLSIKDERLIFPERIVKLIYANGEELQQVFAKSPDIAEFRDAQSTVRFWQELSPKEQAEWLENLLPRIEVKDTQNVVCILDTGVDNGHKLLAPVMSDKDKFSAEEAWGTDDDTSHGTNMAGVVLFGENLKNYLEGSESVILTHTLESSKILPPRITETVELWGDFTLRGVANVEIKKPNKNRIFCMAVTATQDNYDGSPSSWSGAIDALTSGADDSQKRLLLISAGNCDVGRNPALDEYPHFQKNSPIQNPAQAWNAITIGAYTALTNITDSTYQCYTPVANVEELSPFSSTSFLWDNSKWPIKPEVVFEGGNIAVDKSHFWTSCEDLSLLTTNYRKESAQFSTIHATSAATALAANFVARLRAEYPTYWPETIRALMVHSAEWTDALISQFPDRSNEGKVRERLKACGYGVPQLEKALFCSKNHLTLVVEQSMQPYELGSKGKYKAKEMHLYELPWPKEALESLHSTTVTMRVTLSYFVEPSPCGVGWKNKYRYPSHSLRFDINSPGESRSEFEKRINEKARESKEDKAETDSASKFWTIGAQQRDHGSIHSDIWTGTAQDLASSNVIAVYPIAGWWKERKHLGKGEKETRYALIISIESPEQSVDIYTPVKLAIETSVAAKVETPVLV